MQLALSHRQANSQCPKDSFYVSIIAILEGGGCCSCLSGFVFRNLGGHRYNSLGISLKITRWLLQFQKHSLVECREKREEIVAKLALSLISIAKSIPGAPSEFCLHFLGQNIAIWPFLTTGDSGKTSI